ncbi:MAG: hypothetical protein U1B83_06035, partial [Candidatus Cloacimonadaceae bacterium]|nr:hypothetical protein [Candidatus Cloacimonadaceae bacterium]
MEDATKPRLMDDALFEQLKPLYPIISPPKYFAGGHDWSDGTIYQDRWEDAEYLIKVMPLK